MEQKNFNVVIVGQLTLDDFVKYDQPPLLDSPGGSGLYALAGVCYWDIDSLGFITRRGNDYDLTKVFGKIGDRLDLSGIKEMNAPSIHIWNMFDRKGHRYFITQRWGSYDDVMGIYPEDIPDDFRSSRSYLVASFPFDWQSKIIESLPSDSIILADPHFQGVYPPYHDRWNELLKKVSIFLPSEEELIRFFSIEPKEELNEYVPYLKDISERGPQVAGVKVGSRGAVVYDKNVNKAWHVPAYIGKHVLDVTGCGDVFCGGFLASYVKTGDAYLAAAHGVISASLNIEEFGAVHNFFVENKEAVERLNKFMEKLNKTDQELNF